MPLQRREERVCLCSASSIHMKIFTRVTRLVTLRYLSVSHELLVTSSESVGVTTSINSAGLPSDIRRYSDQKCIHVTCLSYVSLSPLYLFFFSCSRNQAESARDMTSQPGYGFSPANFPQSGQLCVCCCGCLHVQAFRLLFFMSLCSCRRRCF